MLGGSLDSLLWTPWPAGHTFIKYILGGGPAKVGEFWAMMPPSQMGNDREFKPNCQNCVVPLALHGDGVAVANIRGNGAKVH